MSQSLVRLTGARPCADPLARFRKRVANAVVARVLLSRRMHSFRSPENIGRGGVTTPPRVHPPPLPPTDPPPPTTAVSTDAASLFALGGRWGKPPPPLRVEPSPNPPPAPAATDSARPSPKRRSDLPPSAPSPEPLGHRAP